MTCERCGQRDATIHMIEVVDGRRRSLRAERPHRRRAHLFDRWLRGQQPVVTPAAGLDAASTVIDMLKAGRA